MTILFQLLCGHALADFALQTEWIAKNKNSNAVPVGHNPALHGPMETIWPYVMTAHALIHGWAVMLATGSVVLGALETVCHWLIDYAKCQRVFGIHVDQALHILCKIVWAAAVYSGVSP